MLRPKLLTTLQDYSRQAFLHDLVAGAIVGVVALPLCIAFAIASGLTPEKGLVTGIIAGFLISALGGSRVQIGGPAGAFVVIVYAIVQQYGTSGLIIATLMAGAILIVMGLVGFGSVIKFIPHPVVAGFTSGIAIIIFTSQIRDLLGLVMPALPPGFLEQWSACLGTISTLNPYAAAISGGTILLLIVWPRISRRIPGSLVALVLATLIVDWLGLPVETIGSRFGDLAGGLPYPQPTQPLTLEVLRGLVQPATAIALLVAIESLLSAVVADGMIGGRHRSNMELVGQGVANMASALFGGMPATGAIARTATNIRNGGRTPVAGMVHAVTLLLITLFFGRWASLIPLSCLAAILVVVAWNMGEWRSTFALLKSPKSDVAVLLTAFGLTVLVDLTAAIEIGMVLSVFLFMKRMAGTTNISVITRELQEDDRMDDQLSVDEQELPYGVEVYEINGPFFFGAVYKFRDAIRLVEKAPRARIVRMAKVNMIDGSGLQALSELYHTCHKQGTTLIISEIHAQPFTALLKAGLVERFGEENVLASYADALLRAREVTAAPKATPIPA